MKTIDAMAALASAGVIAFTLIGCSDTTAGTSGAGGDEPSGSRGEGGDVEGKISPQECYDQYVAANRGAPCGAGEVACGAALSCSSDLDCISCPDRCQPFGCGSDADCQERLGDLCPGVRWKCEQYISSNSCTVDLTGAGDGESSSEVATTGPGGGPGGGGGCTGEDVMCADGTFCIESSWICDGEADCGDGSDESGCQTGCGSEVTCADGSCIPTGWVCDGEPDCAQGEDESEAICGGAICDSGLTFEDPDVTFCLAVECCAEFNDCTGNGSNVDACIACLENGGGSRCDAALRCATDSCGL